MTQHLSRARGSRTTSLLDGTVATHLRAVAEGRPDDLALVGHRQRVRWTYAEFDYAASELARCFIGAGVEAGDRVAVWSINRIEWLVIQHAAAAVGAVLVPLDPGWGDDEVVHVLRHARCQMLIAAANFGVQDNERRLERFSEQAPVLERVVLFDRASWAEFRASGRAVPAAELARRMVAVDPFGPALLQYTGETTGVPKRGVALSHHGILNNAFAVGSGGRLSASDVVCLPVPLHSCFGMVSGALAVLAHGGCVVLPGECFKAGAALEAVQRERCTVLYGGPAMFQAELAHPAFDEYDLSSLTTVVSASSACPPDLAEEVRVRMGVSVLVSYWGMAETSPVVTVHEAVEDRGAGNPSIGRPLPHVQVRIVDAQTRTVVPRGTSGELETRGYHVMLGYWQDEAATAMVLDPAGWLRTGRRAVLRHDGLFELTPTVGDVFVRRGELLYARAIEQLVFTHPDVLGVQVVDVPGVGPDAELIACVVMRDSSDVSVDLLLDRWKGGPWEHVLPDHVVLCDDLAVDATGRVDKLVLRRRALERLALRPRSTTCAT